MAKRRPNGQALSFTAAMGAMRRGCSSMANGVASSARTVRKPQTNFWTRWRGWKREARASGRNRASPNVAPARSSLQQPASVVSPKKDLDCHCEA